MHSFPWLDPSLTLEAYQSLGIKCLHLDLERVTLALKMQL